MLFTVDLLNALLLRKCSATPVSHSRRFGLQGRFHDRSDLIDFIERFSSAARSDIPQTIQPALDETFPPENNRVPVYRKPPGNGGIDLAFGGAENNSTAQSHLLRCAVGCDPLLNLLPVCRRKLKESSQDPG
jgi:hypothetical protein